jgi:cytoskeletal protein CcmA (bactofilin family)
MSERSFEPLVVVASGAEFDGTLVLPVAARIEGRVRGTVLSASDVWVGAEGYVGADLRGERIVVAGTVVGDITARTSIELHATGRVKGDLSAPRLQLAEGAVVDGVCRSGRGASPSS